MRPGLYGYVEIVSRTLGAPLGFGLSVTKHLVVRHNLLGVHSAVHQGGVGHHGLLVGVVVREVPHETDSVPNCVETSRMSSLDVPTSSLVDITIPTD